MKRLLGALALILVLAAPAFSAGQWPQSRVQVIGTDGRPIVGAKATFYEGGTSTPLTTYSSYSAADVDDGATGANPSPIETDGFGRFAPVYFNEDVEFYRVRVTTSAGVVIYDDDVVPIIGPTVGEGGAEVPVDPNALLEAGDIKTRYGTGVLEGFVRCNGRTIGSATSGATERANADTETLYAYLWGADTSLSVAGGRGANAAADYAANKALTLPDCRGRSLVAMDDMGASAAGVTTGLTTLGEVMGSEDYTLLATDLPALTGTAASNGVHTHTVPEQSGSASGGAVLFTGNGVADGTITSSSDGAHTHTVTVNSGTADPISLLSPLMGVTVYIKL